MSLVFADVFQTDRDGIVWSSVGWAGLESGGADCLTLDAELNRRIVLPRPLANLCLRGAKTHWLFTTSSQSMHPLYRGVLVP